MKKTAILIPLFFLLLVSTSNAQVITLPFSDDFESYPVGSQPYSPWFTLAVGKGTITTIDSHSGTKSLSISGGPFSAQTCVLDLGENYPDQISYEVYVKLTGPQSKVFIGFFEQIYNMAPQFNCVYFANGNVYFHSSDRNYPIQQQLSATYQVNQWYKVRAELDFQNLKASVYLNDQLIGENIPMSPKSASWEYYGIHNFLLRKIGIEHFDGPNVLVDDFSVFEQVVQPNLPDLIVELDQPDWPLQLIEGQPIQITGKVKNIGNREAKNIRLTLYQYSYYTQPIPWLEWMRLNQFDFDRLAPQEEKKFSFQWNAVEILNIISADILALVDEENKITESKENNNFDYLSFDENLLLGQRKFTSLKSGFSFDNWELTLSELIDLRTLIALSLTNAGAFGPFMSIIMAEISRHIVLSQHCFGMAATSILFSEYPFLKPSQKINFNFLKEEISPYILSNHINQLPLVLRNGVLSLTGKWPSLSETFEYIKRSINDGKSVILTFSIPNSEGGFLANHSTVAFNFYEESNEIKHIILYDPNFPGMGTAVKLNLEENKASYPTYRNNNHDIFNLIADRPYSTESEITYALIDLIREYLTSLTNILFLNNLRLLVFQSPVHVVIKDEFGNVITDKDGGLNQISGASLKVDEISGIKKFYLPMNLKYQIDIEGFDTGKCTFTMLVPIGQNKAILSEKEFLISEYTKATSIILPEDTSFSLEIDDNGDGTFDTKSYSEIYEYKNWDYEFIDPKRGTGLNINLALKQFQFYTKEKVYQTIYSPEMDVRKLGRYTINTKIIYSNDDINFIADIMDYKKRQLCIALLYDKNKKEFYILISK